MINLPTSAECHDVPHAVIKIFSIWRASSGRQVQIVEADRPMLQVHAASDRVRHRAGLLVDFLLHEMAILAPRGADRIVGDRVHRQLDALAGVERDDLEPVAQNDGHLPVFEKDHLPRVIEDGGQVGRDEHLPLPHTHRHAARVADARSDHAVGLAAIHQHDGLRALEPQERTARRVLKRLAVPHVLLDEMHDGFGVRLRSEGMSLRDQLLAQRGKVLHDAVVDHDEVAGAIGMRVRIDLVGLAVRSPARMADAHVTVERLLVQLALERWTVCPHRAGWRCARRRR